MREVSMSTRVVSSSLWIVAGVIGISTSLVYRVEPLPWAITIALGILAVVVGPFLSCERSRASRVVGGTWDRLGVLLCRLAVWQLGDPAALITDVGLALFGAAAAVVGRRPAVAPA